MKSSKERAVKPTTALRDELRDGGGHVGRGFGRFDVLSMRDMSGPLRRGDGNTDFEHPTLFFLRNDLEAETVELVSHQAPLPRMNIHSIFREVHVPLKETSRVDTVSMHGLAFEVTGKWTFAIRPIE